MPNLFPGAVLLFSSLATPSC